VSCACASLSTFTAGVANTGAMIGARERSAVWGPVAVLLMLLVSICFYFYRPHNPLSSPIARDPLAVNNIPEDQAFVRYADPAATFVVSIPEGWSQTTNGAETAFTSGRNIIRIRSVRTPARPSAADRIDEMPQLAADIPGFQLSAVSTVEVPAGTAVMITYTAGESDIDEVQRYEFWRDGHQLTISLSSPQGSNNSTPWQIVVDSLQWTVSSPNAKATRSPPTTAG
jgi:hypothetical protein